MTDQLQNPEEAVRIAEFNAKVDESVTRVFRLNAEMLSEFGSTAVTLANALCASDLIAAVTVEVGLPADHAEKMIDELVLDMKRRTRAAHALYTEAVKNQPVESEAV